MDIPKCFVGWSLENVAISNIDEILKFKTMDKKGLVVKMQTVVYKGDTILGRFAKR